MKEMVDILSSAHTFKQKMNYLKYRLYPKREILAYSPVMISIVATSRCTLSCDMCPTHSAIVPKDYPYIQKNVRDIEFEMFKEIIDRFRYAIAVHIIGSGEPLLNKDLFKMVDYAAGKRMRVKTFSNGTTIEENIDRILNSKLDGITISLNGHNPKEFNRMTGMSESVYHEICSATRRLIEEKKKCGSRVKVKISFIIDKQNYRLIPDMVALGMHLGADHTFLCNFLPSPYRSLISEHRSLIDEEGIASDINSMALSYPLVVRRKVTFPVLISKRSHKNRCRVHFSQIRFDGDGNISSCSMMLLDMTGHGTYRDENVWNNAFFRRMRILFLSDDDENLPEPCKACPDNKGVAVIG